MSSTRRLSFGAAFLLTMGGLALLYGARISYMQYALLNWPTTEATIVTFKPNWVDDDGGYAHPKVSFTYSHENTTFVGDRLNPSPFNYQDERQLKDDTAGFHAGAKVRCWYDPRSPDKSYLVNVGITDAGVFMTLFGVALTALGVHQFLRDRRSLKSA